MKNKFVLLASIIFLNIILTVSNSLGQILTYTNATNGSLSSVAANVSGTSLIRVNGANTTGSPCSTGFSSSNFSSITTYSSSLAAVEVSVTPNAGFQLNVTSFSADLRRTNKLPAKLKFAYSTNGGSTWTAQSTNQTNPKAACSAGTTLTWSTSFTVSAPTTLKFRIYGFHASATSGVEQILNLLINGTVTSSGSCGVPTNLSASNITSSSATLNWGSVSGSTSYNIQYRKTGTSTWSTASSTTTSTSVSGLTSSTSYEFQVQTVCSGGVTSAFSASTIFTTLAANTVPTPDHVVILILENHAYSTIIGSSAAPHINALANDTNSALFTQSFAIEHPSQPNYLDLYSGSNQGVTNDNVPSNNPFTTANLGSELITASHSFTTYSEDLPSVGFNGATSGNYARKHNPAANWMGTGLNQIPTTVNQPFTAFPSSANYASLPTVSYVVPNQNDDMHNGSDPATITTADNWMFNNLNSYIQWAKTHNSLFILTTDEDDGSHSNQIATILTGPMVLAGQYANYIDHYSVLRTIEDMYSLPHAGNASSPINYCWKSGFLRIASFEQGITTVATDNKVTVYPNPASSHINFNISNPSSAPVYIGIYDETGRSVGDYQMLMTLNLEVSTANLTAGKYYYVMTQNNQLMHSGTFIIAGK